MNDTRHRPRRTLPVVILDAVLGVGAALHSGQLPRWRRREEGATDGGRRSAVFWMIAAGTTVVVGTVSLVMAFLSAPDGLTPLGLGSAPPVAVEQPPGTTTGPTPSPAAGAGGFGSSPPAMPVTARKTPTPGVPSTPAGEPLPLTATYSMAAGGQALLGYQAAVTVANPGSVTTEGWRLVVTLPRQTLTIADVSGAAVERDGATWTFTPNASTATLRAGGSVQVSFRVQGATLIDGKPTACTIDTRPCAGLPD